MYRFLNKKESGISGNQHATTRKKVVECIRSKRLCATVNTTTQNVFREAYTSKHKTTLATLEHLIITNSEKHYLMFGMDKQLCVTCS